MRTLKTEPFDPAKYLATAKSIAAYIADARETGDPDFIADAHEVIARVKGMNKTRSESSAQGKINSAV